MSTKKIEIPITMPQSTRADIKKADAQKKVDFMRYKLYCYSFLYGKK